MSAFFIKGFFDHKGGEFFPPDIYFQLCADLGMGGRKVRQSDACHQGGREDAAGEFPDGFAAGKVNFVMGAGRGSLAGVFNGIKFVTRPMMKQRQGHIINMASVSGIIGNMGQANYSASKAGVIGLTKATAKELSSRGITVNAVAPGFIATEMTDKLSDAVKEEACKTIPLGAFGTVEDVAEAVVFLASDRAKYITGQVLCVDGGIAM